MFLERWTIDQVMEDSVAVARARYLGQIEDADPAALAAKAVDIETRLDPGDWDLEFLSVLDRTELLRELELRNAAPTIVATRVNEEEDSRPLFEGQVLWFVTPRRLPELRRKLPIGPADTGWLFTRVPLHGPSLAERELRAGTRRARREVWQDAGQIVDATQASRIGVKREYQALLEAEQPAESS